MNKDYIITKDRILLVDVVRFIDYTRYSLIMGEENLETEDLRKVVFVDGHMIDFETGDEIPELKNDSNGLVNCDIYYGILYWTQTYKCPEVTDDDLIYAAKIYDNFLAKQELFEEKKLLKFTPPLLYHPK